MQDETIIDTRNTFEYHVDVIIRFPCLLINIMILIIIRPHGCRWYCTLILSIRILESVYYLMMTTWVMKTTTKGSKREIMRIYRKE
jgi:hypothetical protein